MRKNLYLKLGTVSLVLAMLMSGCSKSVIEPELGLTDLDKQEITQSIDGDALFTSDASTLNDDGAGLTMGKTATPIYPRAWGRKIRPDSVSRTITFEQPNDTTVVATVKTVIKGTVIILAKTLALNDTIITKPFVETTTRKIKFYKNPLPVGRRWIHREVSAVKGGTEGSLVTINQLRAIWGTDTLTIDDPLNYFLKLGRWLPGREVPALTPNFAQTITVQVSLTSADPDTDIVALHRPYMMGPGLFKPLGVRMQMLSQTQNGNSYNRVYSYQRSWDGLGMGRHHVFVSALTRSSIFDDAAAFSSQLWGVPYIVN